MADQANKLIAQLQADVIALQEAATAEALAVTAATAAAAVAGTDATAAAIQQAAAAATQQGAAAAVPPVFTLAPVLANTAAFLDFTSSNGAKHFKGATKALNSHAFDFENDSDLQVFLHLVLTKSQVWALPSPKSGARTPSLTFLLQMLLPELLGTGTSSPITGWSLSSRLGSMLCRTTLLLQSKRKAHLCCASASGF
jgi:hypothetical protein